MALFAQILDDKGVELHHRVVSFEDHNEPTADGSISIIRSFTLGCGEKVEARGDRLSEADVDPGGPRHVAKGCFKTQAS